MRKINYDKNNNNKIRKKKNELIIINYLVVGAVVVGVFSVITVDSLVCGGVQSDEVVDDGRLDELADVISSR